MHRLRFWRARPTPLTPPAASAAWRGFEQTSRGARHSPRHATLCSEADYAGAVARGPSVWAAGRSCTPQCEVRMTILLSHCAAAAGGTGPYAGARRQAEYALYPILAHSPRREPWLAGVGRTAPQSGLCRRSAGMLLRSVRGPLSSQSDTPPGSYSPRCQIMIAQPCPL